jgi:hypothetical protein
MLEIIKKAIEVIAAENDLAGYTCARFSRGVGILSTREDAIFFEINQFNSLETMKNAQKAINEFK